MVFNRNDNENGTMGNIRGFFGQDRVKYFVAGMAAAYVIKKISETDAAHDAMVSLTAGALEVRDSLEESFENIREDAEDIHAEAQEKQKVDIYEPEEYEIDIEDIEDIEDDE